LAKASLKKRIAGPFKNPPLENFTGSCTYIWIWEISFNSWPFISKK
jgi:hypothetical protein